MPATTLLVALYILPYTSAAENSAVAGRWIVSADFLACRSPSPGARAGRRKTCRDFEADKVEGSFSGDAVHFLARNEPGGTEECQAVLKSGTLSGTLIFAGSDDPVRKESPSAVVAKIKPVTAN